MILINTLAQLPIFLPGEWYMKIKKLPALVLLLISMVSLQAQEILPRVAILPFDSINVSKADTAALWVLFETAMVKTAAFDVMEQNKISEVMDAQKQSLAGCTDESCAIEVGKLLSAEQIVLGTVSAVGDKYLVSAKIIDVTLGRNIRADRVESGSVAGLTDGVELLAFKLAGLPLTEGTMIATEFGELFIETSPSEAEILVNGEDRGRSPVLVSRIPIGRATVEAKKDSLYGMQEIEVSKNMGKVSIALEPAKGVLFIKSSNGDVRVILNDVDRGALGSGLFEDLPVGHYSLRLEGKGIGWVGELDIRPNASTQINAFPRSYGEISYRIPEGAKGTIKGSGYSETLEGQGLLSPVWEGDYTISVSGANYEPFSEKISIGRASFFLFSPTLNFTKEFEHQLFSDQLEGIKTIRDSGKEPSITDLENAKLLKSRMVRSKWDFPVLKRSVDEIITIFSDQRQTSGRRDRISELNAQIADLENKIMRRTRSGRGMLTGGLISIGTGIASLVAAGYSYIEGGNAYSEYTDAQTSNSAIEEREKVELYSAVFTAAAIAGGVTLLAGTTLVIARPNIEKLHRDKITIEKELAELTIQE